MKQLREELAHTLTDTDVLVMTTCMQSALPLESVDTAAKTYPRLNAAYSQNTALTAYLNLASISIPCGFTDQGLPVGVMICGSAAEPEKVLRVAEALEDSLESGVRRPDFSWLNGRAENG